MSDRLNITLVQSPAELDGSAERLYWLEHQLQQLHRTTDLVLLPELFGCGYNIGENIQERAENKDDQLAQKIIIMAKAHNVAIHYGYAERDNGNIYNSAQCFSASGERLGSHRKLALPPGFEADHFVAGQGCQLFDLKGFRVATLICYDVEFPETVRHVSEAGADLILVPTALAKEWRAVAEHLIPTRAFESGCFIAYANQAGVEHGMPYFGGSCIVGSQGQVLARAGALPQIINATINKEDVAAARVRLPYHTDRKNIRF